MSAVEVDGLGKRFGRRWALRDCTLGLPAGRVVGLVGANGAGKSTLLQLVVGLLEPTEGSVTVAGGIPGRDGAQMARVGFVAQDAPVYSSLTVGEHLELGARLNPGWDAAHAAERVRAAELDVTQRAGHLSGGQRAQLALSLAMGKRPEVLVLDEPVASLDPLARRQFLAALMGTVAAGQPTIILSSHLLADIERVCDHLVVVDRGRVRVEGAVDALLATHRVLTGPRRSAETLPADQTVVHASHTDRQTTVVVRTEHPILDPAWIVGEIGLEELVLAYMEGGPAGAVAPARLAAVPS